MFGVIPFGYFLLFVNFLNSMNISMSFFYVLFCLQSYYYIYLMFF